MTSLPRPRVALLGAYDRFNYGDLLFPIIAKQVFAETGANSEVGVFALADSNLSTYGGLPTQALRDLYRPGALRAGDVVMFVGGGTVGVGWTHMYANLLGRRANLALYYLGRVFGEQTAENFSRWRLGGRSPFPWVAAPDDFMHGSVVAYNAVGASELAGVPAPVREGVLQRMASARYLSVRDAESQKLLAPIADKVKVELAPDSAVLMSTFFPRDELMRRSSPAHRDLVGAGDYICFHCNYEYATEFGDQIVRMLDEAYERHKLPIVLLPIGRYVGLDDPIGLRALHARLSAPARMVSTEANIWEIMLTIAQARAFIGTSLHGHVTSQSFAVPHVGLSDKPCKVDYYLEAWEIEEQQRCIELARVPAHLDTVLSLPKARLESNRDRLIANARANFERMARACGYA